jgi:N-glycosylase/DNA lyase
VRDYDLDATLASGQAFRWRRDGTSWVGVISGRWVRLTLQDEVLSARAVLPQQDWTWLSRYLQLDVDLDAVLRSFPNDGPMRTAVAVCRGLRLLRQEPWECLASFLMSATKQIVQIQAIVELLCNRHGDPIPGPSGDQSIRSFPSAERIAALSEGELRRCKMGFRATHLMGAAHAVAQGHLDLARLQELPLDQARAQLMKLDGVGPKIADCVLLFACGFHRAFPVDVWVQRVLSELYFQGRRMPLRTLRDFAAAHFGPHAGYAQQYLFHYARTRRQQRLSV